MRAQQGRQISLTSATASKVFCLSSLPSPAFQSLIAPFPQRTHRQEPFTLCSFFVRKFRFASSINTILLFRRYLQLHWKRPPTIPMQGRQNRTKGQQNMPRQRRWQRRVHRIVLLRYIEPPHHATCIAFHVLHCQPFSIADVQVVSCQRRCQSHFLSTSCQNAADSVWPRIVVG